jgi:hypothetical protein
MTVETGLRTNGWGGKREGSGRRPGSPNLTNLKFVDLCRVNSPRAIERLVELMNQNEDRRLAFDAACAIIAHAHGKPRESSKIEQYESSVTVGYASLEELRQAVIAEGVPLDRLEEPKLIERGKP